MQATIPPAGTPDITESTPYARGSAAYAQTLVDERYLISTSSLRYVDAFDDNFVQ